MDRQILLAQEKHYEVTMESYPVLKMQSYEQRNRVSVFGWKMQSYEQRNCVSVLGWDHLRFALNDRALILHQQSTKLRKACATAVAMLDTRH